MKNDICNMNSEELEFVLFCIESVAEKLNIGAEKVFSAIAERSDILQSYIIPGYDILHTQGKEYITEDILTVMKERGVSA